MINPPRVAIVHDWLVGGGAERVVEELHNLYPDAPIYTAYCSAEWQARLAPAKVITSYMQHWPLSSLRRFLPVLRQRWFEKLNFSGFDLVISSSGNGEAKGIKVPAGVKHVCYCHSPTHFYWRHYNEYMKRPGFGVLDPLARLGLRVLVAPLRRWDLRAAKRPDLYIANSTHIQKDIKKYYGRDSVVIHPPVNTERFKLSTAPRQGFVTVGRLKPYKRVDVLIEACNRLKLPLTIVGNGPDYKLLKAMAGPTIVFARNASDQDVERYLGNAQAFLFAAHEDFGVAPVEAMSAGTPVIAYQAGGALDYVKPGINGQFFAEQTAASLANVLRDFKPSDYKAAAVHKSVQDFSVQSFRAKMTKLLGKS